MKKVAIIGAEHAWADFCNITSDHEAIAALMNASRTQTYARGETLIEQGDNERAVYLITSGRVKINYVSEAGQEIWLSDCGPGALLGEIACLAGTPRTSFIIALEPVTALRSEQADFITCLQAHSVITMAVLKLVVARLSATSYQMVEALSLPVTERVQWELARLGERDDVEIDKFVLRTPPTVTHLAQRVHATREAASRALSELEARGLFIRGKTTWQIALPPQSLTP